MDHCSWRYRDSPKGLHMMNYYHGVEGFINYTLSNLRNINESNIRCLGKRCKSKKNLNPDVIMMHLLL